ncbi:MAG: DUF2284 domain-containing protein [Desulfobulbus sp.]|jgi:predicted metal-binding protein
MHAPAAENDAIDQLREMARQLGADKVVLLPIDALSVEERFAALCAGPTRCPSYGLCPGCPPHAMRPEQFRKLLPHYRWVLAFKIDAPLAELSGPGRLPLARTIHRIAAVLEQTGIDLGISPALGLAAGSCRDLFCADLDCCVVLQHGSPCPHANKVRPSLSAVGVDFARIAEAAGWPYPPDTRSDREPMAMLAGLVLLGRGGSRGD